MIAVIKQSGHITYRIMEFVLDTESELSNLPLSGIAPGSTAFVISKSAVYMFNGKEWKEI